MINQPTIPTGKLGLPAERRVFRILCQLVLDHRVVTFNYQDKPGVDFEVTLPSGLVRKIQVKTSRAGVQKHNKNYPDVPVVIAGGDVHDEDVQEQVEMALYTLPGQHVGVYWDIHPGADSGSTLTRLSELSPDPELCARIERLHEEGKPYRLFVVGAAPIVQKEPKVNAVNPESVRSALNAMRDRDGAGVPSGPNVGAPIPPIRGVGLDVLDDDGVARRVLRV